MHPAQFGAFPSPMKRPRSDEDVPAFRAKIRPPPCSEAIISYRHGTLHLDNAETFLPALDAAVKEFHRDDYSRDRSFPVYKFGVQEIEIENIRSRLAIGDSPSTVGIPHWDRSIGYCDVEPTALGLDGLSFFQYAKRARSSGGDVKHWNFVMPRASILTLARGMGTPYI